MIHGVKHGESQLDNFPTLLVSRKQPFNEEKLRPPLRCQKSSCKMGVITSTPTTENRCSVYW